MRDFSYYAPTEVAFGKESEEQVALLVKKYGGTKVLFYYHIRFAILPSQFRLPLPSLNSRVAMYIDYFNLDMIISVGYKVNSKRGIKFRQWASSVLKEYLLKGYAINNIFLYLATIYTRHLNQQQQLDVQRFNQQYN